MPEAPKLTGETWFNTEPLTNDQLKGRVVLYDFWTYSCVNCLRTIPVLKDWWAKYKDMGFVMIGIHTPEFDFEKDPKNVEQALKDLGITWPVVMDNDFKNWNNFANQYWPAKYLANQNSEIVYTHFGEGNYKETEEAIQELLGNKELMPAVESKEHGHGNVCFIASPEIYCGYGRGELSNHEGYAMDRLGNYEKPQAIKQDSIGLAGKFIAMPEYVESTDDKSTLFLNFRGTEVNLVMASTEDEAIVEITMSGHPLPKKIHGKDVNDKGEVRVSKSQLFNLIKDVTLVEGILEIKAKKGAFRAYAFTFSGCKS
jgi:thiol-disulfide isomerase/thioredoxin